MEDKKCLIVNGCRELFRRFGIKSLTMADIARKLGVSTKTLYQHVGDKNELVTLAVTSHFTKYQDFYENTVMVDTRKNAIDQFLDSSTYLLELLSEFHPNAYYEMSKFHPTAKNYVDDFFNGFVKEKIYENLERGIDENLYRKNIEKSFVFSLYKLVLTNILDGYFLNQTKMSHHNVYREFYEYHIHGLVTPSGLQYFKSKINNKLYE